MQKLKQSLKHSVQINSFIGQCNCCNQMKVRISDHKIPLEIIDTPSKLQNTYTDIV